VFLRSEPSSRAALMGEQPNPWDLSLPPLLVGQDYTFTIVERVTAPTVGASRVIGAMYRCDTYLIEPTRGPVRISRYGRSSPGPLPPNADACLSTSRSARTMYLPSAPPRAGHRTFAASVRESGGQEGPAVPSSERTERYSGATKARRADRGRASRNSAGSRGPGPCRSPRESTPQSRTWCCVTLMAMRTRNPRRFWGYRIEQRHDRSIAVDETCQVCFLDFGKDLSHGVNLPSRRPWCGHSVTGLHRFGLVCYLWVSPEESRCVCSGPRMRRADIEVPNLPVDVDSRGRSACYPRGSFYPLSPDPSTRGPRIT